MPNTIYVSSFRTGPDATKKQQMLFATDTAYAMSEGYAFIEDSQGIVYQILDEFNILEFDEDACDECDEDCDECEIQQDPTECDFDPTAPAEEINNPATIDLIIHNILHQREPLRADQVDSLLNLAKLRILLGGTFNE